MSTAVVAVDLDAVGWEDAVQELCELLGGSQWTLLELEECESRIDDLGDVGDGDSWEDVDEGD